MRREKDELQIDYFFFAIVDVIHLESRMLVCGDAESVVVSTAFDVDVVDDMANLGSRISRKKDLIPAITRYLSQL